jgi:hypothetical protein
VPGGFTCPNCSARLQEGESYAQWTVWGSVVLVGLILIASGLRGLHLLYAMLLAIYPILFVSANYMKYLVTPKVEVYLPKDATLNLRDQRQTHETKDRTEKRLH